jgi:glycerol-3-phosphate dehydrogenase
MPSPRPALAELARPTYDLIIVGGGINGAGLLREAAQRGLSALLVEAQDFAFGASSRSTKLLHGGLRYLEHRDFALVAESLKERRILTEVLAPHLTRPLPFLIPVLKGEARPGWLIRLGLWLYDILAWKGRGLIKAHRWLGPEAARALAPSLVTEGLRGAAEYWDCQMDDSRLVLENLLDAQRLGARALNYCRLMSAHRLAEGDVRLRLRDEEAGVEGEVKGRLLVVAGGAWTDRIFEALGLKGPAKVKPTKGIHIVTRRLIDEHALLLQPRSDGRVFFVVPWWLEGKPASLLGTTDSDFSGDPDHVRAEEGEIAYLLNETARVLPGAKLTRTDVQASYAGLRPLTAPLPARSHSNGAVSREHKLWEEPGVLAVTGGKYTTYRSLCLELAERAAQRLGRTLPPSRSHVDPLPGAPRQAAEAGEAAALHLEQTYGLSPDSAALLVQHYGRLARDVAALIDEDPEWKKPLAPGTDCPAILAMAVWAARHEHCAHLDDFYLRRTQLGLRLPPDHKGVDRVAGVMGRELWWDRERENEEIERLKKVLMGEYR